MASTKEFIESVCTVVNAISNCGFKVACRPNTNNEESLTFIVYKNTAVEITIKVNGIIRMVFDRELSTGKVFSKVPYDFTGSIDKPNCSAIEYGYTESACFPEDFSMI